MLAQTMHLTAVGQAVDADNVIVASRGNDLSVPMNLERGDDRRRELIRIGFEVNDPRGPIENRRWLRLASKSRRKTPRRCQRGSGGEQESAAVDGCHSQLLRSVRGTAVRVVSVAREPPSRRKNGVGKAAR